MGKTYTSGLDKKYIQVADINLSGIRNFEPIGVFGNNFTGDFDGGGYTINNLTVAKGTTDYVGLFGRVEGATFKNIGLEDVNIKGRNNIGGLVGYQKGSSITNSYATGQVSGSRDVGGLAGGQDDYSVLNSYYDTQTTGRTSSVGCTGKTTVEMKLQSTYSGWDNSIWKIEDGKYPSLKTQQ